MTTATDDFGSFRLRPHRRGLTLRPHQETAVRAACDEFGHAERALIVAACGTGKTVIGAEISARVAPDGRVLVVLPTLELLAQTASAYAGHLGVATGRVAAVCGEAGETIGFASMRDELDAAHAGITTDPASIARLAGEPGRLTVFSTYQSLPAILEAHRSHGLPAWDLLVVDEAHRSAGRAERAWNAVHHEIAARRRLYMTATPRIMGESDYDTVSMDDAGVFGREVYRLGFGDAIAEGLLADYRVVVSVITDEQVHRHVYDKGSVIDMSGRPVPVGMVAAQISLLKTARAYDLRRMLTFHRRVLSATVFAQSLGQTAVALPEGQRPEALRAEWVAGVMNLADRRAILSLLDDDEHTTVISNARVLGEGVDVPELDAVMFADPRDSQTDVVQAVGRALRRGERPEKTATIIIPLMVAGGEADAAALDGSAYDMVWRTIRALRAHDERLADWLDASRVRLTFGDEHMVGRIHELPDWLIVDGDSLPSGFAEAITVRIVETSSSSWWATYARVAAFKQRVGHLKPDQREYPAEYNFVHNARQRYKQGRLAPDQVAALQRLGVVLDQRAERHDEFLENARIFHAGNGHLRVPQSYKVPETGYPLGSRINIARTRRETLPEHVREALDALGMAWSVHDEQFAELLRHATAHVEAAGPIGMPVSNLRCACCGTYTLGARLVGKSRLVARGALPADQGAALAKLGVKWDSLNRADRRDRAFERGLAAVEAWLAANPNPDGTPRRTLDVPVGYIAADGFRTGEFISRMRALHAGTRPAGRGGGAIDLPDRWRRRLDELGMIWSMIEGRREATDEEIARIAAMPEGGGRAVHRARTAAIAELVDEGVTASSIADALGIKRPTLSYALKRHREHS